MLNNVKKDAEQRMQKTVRTLEDDLAKLRAGRANASLLDNVVVPYYGGNVPLSQVASIAVESALMITVKPWEKNLIAAIEKAIRSAGLGLNPANSGDMIRVPLPPLSEERRKELIKQVKSEGEDAKVAIRNIRRDANNQSKELLKDKAISEDDERKSQDLIQKLTDKFTHDVDQVLAKKEKDLMAI